MNGADTPNAIGVYGTLGVAAPTNVPTARLGSVTWTDLSGNLWLFGGQVPESTGDTDFINDLWQFNIATNAWTWVSGSSAVNARGDYGVLGVAAASNVPGARSAATGWTDSKGNFWLFGGLGVDSNGEYGYLNDLWEFNPTSKEWDWVGGTDLADAVGNYGTLGVANSSNAPAGRYFAVGWTDNSDDLWLFGGWAEFTTAAGIINDLWEFDPRTSEWTWISGSDALLASGVYGTQGVSAAGNVPGSRQGAIGWRDASGNLWLFGGSGYASNANGGWLNDLWEFNPQTNQWTWMYGADTPDSNGSYGTLGVANASSVPGAREFATGWTDSAHNFWLFGGWHSPRWGTASSTTYGSSTPEPGSGRG
jgi:N-acetylneuraminic acid mutarotase